LGNTEEEALPTAFSWMLLDGLDVAVLILTTCNPEYLVEVHLFAMRFLAENNLVWNGDSGQHQQEITSPSIEHTL
jgi:hypothetical protein